MLTKEKKESGRKEGGIKKKRGGKEKKEVCRKMIRKNEGLECKMFVKRSCAIAG